MTRPNRSFSGRNLLTERRMLVHLLILNYNGRSLLAQCLPSVLCAAGASRHRCDVVVVDNDSTDDSVDWLAECFPEVRVIRQPNRGLSSYNEVVASLATGEAVACTVWRCHCRIQ